jgi:peptidoglycan hydrolase-like protein with peptidoglycan-binding domain
MAKRCNLTAVVAAVLALVPAPALAQAAPPPPAPVASAAQPDPAFEAARLAFEALPEPERRAIQDALVWTGDHVGVVSGAFGRRTFEAIAAYQKRLRLTADGILPPKPRADLLAAAQRAKDAVGFKPNRDARAGVEIGVPEKLLRSGKRTQRRHALAERRRPDHPRHPRPTRRGSGPRRPLRADLAIQAPDRKVLYKVQRPDFFVVGGETATGKFYTRAAVGPGGIRGFSLGYDKELAKDLDRAVIAVANSFVPFPAAPPRSGRSLRWRRSRPRRRRRFARPPSRPAPRGQSPRVSRSARGGC